MSFGRPLRMLFATSILFAVSLPAPAGVNRWTSIGPVAQGVGAFAVAPTSPSTIYANAAGGVLKTTDGGQSWTAVNNGLPGGPLSAVHVQAIAIDPSSSSTVYVSTFVSIFGRAQYTGVYKTTNGGMSWAAVNNGLPIGFGGTLAIDPTSPSTVFHAGTGGVFKSTDGGNSWMAVNNGLPSQFFVGSLVIDPRASSTLYAGTRDGGVFKTTDGGSGWGAVNDGLVRPVCGVYMPGTVSTNVGLAIDATSPSTVYAAVSASCPFPLPAIYEVFKTRDGGMSWTAVNTPLTGLNLRQLAIAPTSPSAVYAATFGGGVFRSKDGGASWIAVNDGLPDLRVVQLAIDPISPTTVYAVTVGGDISKIIFDEGVCTAGPTTLCLNNGRFKVQVRWRVPSQGTSGSGTAVALTGDTGAFWFFSGNNVELVAKVVDGRAFNGRFWVFHGALSNVEYTITVTDTTTGSVKTYFNPQSQLASVADTAAF